MFRFWEGPHKKTSAMLMMRLHPTDGVGFASGMNFSSVDQWRAKAADDKVGPALAEAIASIDTAATVDVDGASLKKVPKPYDQDHPRADLLRHKGLQVRFIEESPAALTKPDFVDWSVERLHQLGDVHRWLVQHMLA